MKAKLDMFSLLGKVALVTGGGGGLGRVFCETLAQWGADVAIMDVDVGGAEETAQLVRGSDRKALVVEGDVNSPEDTVRMAEATVGHFGGIDILVNNAGVSAKPGRVGETTIEDWDRVLGVDLRGVFLCAKACLPIMVSRGAGTIINIASILGMRPFPTIGGEKPNFPYGVAKAGVIRLTKEIAVDYARDGIRANCIAPDWHGGTRLSSRWPEGFAEAGERRRYEEGIVGVTPMGRRGAPSELKGLLVFLASDASSFMTGQVLISDGGACL